MTSVKLLTDVLATDRAVEDRWYVSDGATAIGPVNLELIERGVEAGKVPLESFLRHEGWKVWRSIRELAVIDGAAEEEITSEEIISVSEPAAPQRFDTRGEWPAQTMTMETPADWSVAKSRVTDDILEPARFLTPDEISPADEIAGASDRRDALLLLLPALVSATQAEGAIVHEVNDDGAVALCAHGPQMFDLLGERTKLLDAILVAAAAGSIVIAEPTPGPAGQAMQSRLTRLGINADGAIMMPIRPFDRLVAFLEVGRSRSFAPREIAAVGALVDAVVAKLETF